MNELSKAILKAKKLLRLTESQNENESKLAKSQLEKLKIKYKLTDSMIFPIKTQTVFSLNKDDKLNAIDEYLFFNIGELFANKVLVENKKDIFNILYRGNELTIEKSLSSISFINRYVDRHLESLEIDDKYSFKCGVCISICDYLKTKIHIDKLIEDEKTETDKPIKFSQIQDNNEIEPVKKDKLDNDSMDKGKLSVNLSFLIAIEEFIKGIL